MMSSTPEEKLKNLLADGLITPAEFDHFMGRTTITAQESQIDGSMITGRVDAGGDVTGRDKTITQENSGNSGGFNANIAGSAHIQDSTFIAEQHIHQYAPPPPQPGEHPLRQTYLRWVMEQCSLMTLDTIDPQAAAQPEARLHLGAVYTALQTTRWEKKMWSWDMVGRGNKQRSVMAELNDHPYLVLLGDPGSGKSTFLNFVGLCLAGAMLQDPVYNLSLLTNPLPSEINQAEKEKREPTRQPWVHGGLMPLRVVLRDLAAAGPAQTAGDLWHFLTASFKAKLLDGYIPALQEELRQKGGIILFDGLDEVPEAAGRRAHIKQLIEETKTAFPLCHILVTCRIYAYQEEAWHLPTFEKVVLAPFSAEQMTQFVVSWYNHTAELKGLDPAEAQGRGKLLLEVIQRNPRLQGLAQQPLLLTLMASLHAWRGGNLPNKRQELYEDVVQLLLDKWESQRTKRGADGQHTMIQPSLEQWLKISDRDKTRKLLNRLAFEAHAGQAEARGTADIPETKLVMGLLEIAGKTIPPQQLIEYLCDRAGLLLPRLEGVYTLPHRTFQEYLSACHLTDTQYPKELARLARQEPEKWREVLLLAGAKVKNPFAVWALVQALCPRTYPKSDKSLAEQWGAHLAGELIEECLLGGEIEEEYQETHDKVQEWLTHLLRTAQLPALERAKAGQVLAKLGDPRPGVLTVDDLELCFVPPGNFVMGSDEDEPHEVVKWKPAHEVALPYPYWLSRFPVTEAQYQQFVDDGGYSHEPYWVEARRYGGWREGKIEVYTWQPNNKSYWKIRANRADYGEPFTLPNHPVVGVCWYEALAFTRWLTDHWHKLGLLPSNWRVSLPSEAEWEKGARGGHQRPLDPFIQPIQAIKNWELSLPLTDNTPYPVYAWLGEELTSEHANYDEAKIESSSAVGCFPLGISPAGCEEMLGNVWEWTSSTYGEWKDGKEYRWLYPYKLGDGREVLEQVNQDSTLCVVRGAGYNLSDKFSRSMFRDGNFSLSWNAYYGFRLCVSRFFM